MQTVKLLLGVDASRCAATADGGAQVSATVDGVVRAPFMQQRPPVIIVTSLPPIPAAAPSETRVCITLRKPCESLEELCGGTPFCWYALLDSDAGLGCCAVGQTTDPSW